jgi:short-subunit dehydrogenase
MVDINLHGVIHGMKIALPRMMARNRGHVVNIASQAGKYGAPGGATYSATKHAVIGLTEAVRGELHIEGSPVELSYVMPFVVKTELGDGLEDARGMRKLEPADVADAIVDAIKRGVVDVWVPRSARHTHRLNALLPRRASETVARALKADRVLMGADQQARAAYELRAARSEPGLEPGEEPRQLAS